MPSCPPHLRSGPYHHYRPQVSKDGFRFGGALLRGALPHHNVEPLDLRSLRFTLHLNPSDCEASGMLLSAALSGWSLSEGRRFPGLLLLTLLKSTEGCTRVQGAGGSWSTSVPMTWIAGLVFLHPSTPLDMRASGNGSKSRRTKAFEGRRQHLRHLFDLERKLGIPPSVSGTKLAYPLRLLNKRLLSGRPDRSLPLSHHLQHRASRGSKG